MDTPLNIAKYIVYFFQECGDPLTNLKLQKLLYYAQGWHLAIKNHYIFEEDFQAWIHGPVIKSVFDEYKSYKWYPINKEQQQIKLLPDLKSHIDDVLNIYGSDNAWQLELRTHREAPWIDARGNLSPDEPSTQIITKESMQKFFKKEMLIDG